MGRDFVANKYLDLEFKLGLIKQDDDNIQLQVDREFYKWVMINYKEDEHEYYLNCVAKKIGLNEFWGESDPIQYAINL